MGLSVDDRFDKPPHPPAGVLRVAFASLFFTRFPSVARAAKNLKIQIRVGATVLERQDVIDVRVFAVADLVACPARERVPHKNPLTLGDPVRGKVMRSLLRRLHAALVRWSPSWDSVWHRCIQSRFSGSLNLGRISSRRR